MRTWPPRVVRMTRQARAHAQARTCAETTKVVGLPGTSVAAKKSAVGEGLVGRTILLPPAPLSRTLRRPLAVIPSVAVSGMNDFACGCAHDGRATGAGGA